MSDIWACDFLPRGWRNATFFLWIKKDFLDKYKGYQESRKLEKTISSL